MVNLTAALVAGSGSRSDLEVKVTELCEPTGDVMYKYINIYYINVMNTNTGGVVGCPQQG